MKKIRCMLFLAILISGAVRGQEHRIPVQNNTDGRLILINFPGDIPVEGYAGNEIIITAEGEDFLPPERAKGLKPIYPGGSDNTGIGLEVNKNGNSVSVSCMLPITKSAEYKLKVPENLSLEFESGCERSGQVTITNMKNEIEIQNCQGIDLKNVSGPLVLSSIAGDINIEYDSPVPDKPLSINSINGEVEIRFPAKTAANLELNTVSGSFYSDFDFPEIKDNMKKIGGNDFSYALNGGGPKISITTVTGNIYIRKGK